MKPTTIAMVIIIAIITIGMTSAYECPPCPCPTPKEDTTESHNGFMSSLTSQEILDYYGELYAAGDRSPSTIHAIRIFEERYGMTTTVMGTTTETVTDVTVVKDPAPVVKETAVPTPTAEPVIVTAPVEEDLGGNLTLLIIIALIIIGAVIIYVYSCQNKKE